MARKLPSQAFLGSLLFSALAIPVSAETNPFAIQQLASGYGEKKGQQTPATDSAGKSERTSNISSRFEKSEGKCGSGQCGSSVPNASKDGKSKKAAEGFCGSNGKCGWTH